MGKLGEPNVTTPPWKVWDDAVKSFDMDRLGASDTEPRGVFRWILKSAAEGKPYPVRRNVFEEDDFADWQLYSASALTEGMAWNKEEAQQAWVAKVSAFDDYMRRYHSDLSAACEAGRQVAKALKE